MFQEGNTLLYENWDFRQTKSDAFINTSFHGKREDIESNH